MTDQFRIRPRHHSWRWFVAVITPLFMLMMVALGVVWYQSSLRPVDPRDDSQVRLIIKQGETASDIARNLKQARLIRSEQAFRLYSQLTGTKERLQTGAYALKRSQSIPEIIDHISTGQTDEISVTILPGKTLAEIKQVLIDDGFAEFDVTNALEKTYNHPLFKDKPSGTSLEGYIYPETYRVYASDSVESLLLKSFDEFERVLTADNVDVQLQGRGLNRYQGLTLASIVQMEVANADEQRQVAQVFLRRLSINMPLGSDVTFFYAAKQLGVEPSPSLDSPYNTRIRAGLPPGPIATFNLSALQAVMQPAEGDYLYFVAGDDGKTYFTRTEDEHNAAIQAHCHTLCQ